MMDHIWLDLAPMQGTSGKVTRSPERGFLKDIGPSSMQSDGMAHMRGKVASDSPRGHIYIYIYNQFRPPTVSGSPLNLDKQILASKKGVGSSAHLPNVAPFSARSVSSPRGMRWWAMGPWGKAPLVWSGGELCGVMHSLWGGLGLKGCVSVCVGGFGTPPPKEKLGRFVPFFRQSHPEEDGERLNQTILGILGGVL